MSNTPKRYKLLKPLPNLTDKVDFLYDEESGMYKSVGCDYTGKYTYYSKEVIIDSLGDWFEEVLPEQPERIEVGNVWLNEDRTKDYKLGWYAYGFNINVSIHPQQFPAIKQAIEQVLNNDTPDNQSKDEVEVETKGFERIRIHFDKVYGSSYDYLVKDLEQLLFKDMYPEKTDTVVEDKGFIGVEVFGLGKEGADATIRVHNMNHAIPTEKMGGIKVLVQNFLSNYFRVHADNTWSVHSEGQKTFTQSEVDAIREEKAEITLAEAIARVYKSKQFHVIHNSVYDILISKHKA